MKSEFLKSVSNEIRKRHYSIKTEHTYLHWITCFIRHHNLQHPGTVALKVFINYCLRLFHLPLPLI